jgi:hypothetical protein
MMILVDTCYVSLDGHAILHGMTILTPDPNIEQYAVRIGVALPVDGRQAQACHTRVEYRR